MSLNECASSKLNVIVLHIKKNFSLLTSRKDVSTNTVLTNIPSAGMRLDKVSLTMSGLA